MTLEHQAILTLVNVIALLLILSDFLQSSLCLPFSMALLANPIPFLKCTA